MAILFASGVALNTRAQTPSQSAFLGFVGYENQRADLFPAALTAVHGAALSLERVTPQEPVSLLLDLRIGHRSGWYFGGCEVCISPSTTPNAQASNIQSLLLAGARASLSVRGGRAFADALVGVGYLGWSGPGAGLTVHEGAGSPLVEAGAGIDVPVLGVVSARVRASILASDWNDDQWDGWRHHPGVSAGLVVKL